MKKIIDGIIVVEGTGDSSYLSSFIDALFIETNGFDIKETDLDFLENVNKKILVLTDSDLAGDQIRQQLLKRLPKAIDIRVNSNKCNKKGKHGVAECEKEEIINVLKEHFIERKTTKEIISLSNLISITNNQKEIKNKISKYFHLGTIKNKEMLKRLNIKEIDLATIEKELKLVYGNK